MLRIDERLGLAVAALLVAIGFDRVAAEMPDDRRRAEADGMAGILKPPADVDIVAGGAVDRVEPAEAEQGLAAERHVAAGDVLGDLVAEQHMGRAARRHRDRGRDEAVLGRREIRSAAGAEPARFHRGDEIGQPVGVGDAIAVGVGDDLAGRRLGADIAGDAQALVRLADDPAIGIALGDFEGAVARAVIDDDDLVIGIVEHLQRGEAGIHRALGIIGADHDRDPRVMRQRRRQRAQIGALDLGQRRLGLALAVDEAERPVLDQVAAGEPLVGPGKYESAGNPGRERGADLPGQIPAAAPPRPRAANRRRIRSAPAAGRRRGCAAARYSARNAASSCR